MNAKNRRTFRRALSASLGLSIGQTMNRGSTQARIVQIAPNGTRSVLVKRRDNRTVAWPLKECTYA